MTTYYVSSLLGSDKNAGTSASAPLATLQAAAGLVRPGDTVEVMTGTYTGPEYGDVLDITTSGTANAPITFEAAPGQTPVIDSTGTWNAINVQASYIIINGFTVVGDAANYTLAQALAGYGEGNAELNGNGIGVNGTNGLASHVTIENNTVYNEPGGGIYTENADYVQILNNIVHDNAHWSGYGNSGISVSTSANLDTAPGPHIIVSGNISYNNTELVPVFGGDLITDGEGIILDTNPGYTGGFLVQGNTTYGNSGPGIESFQSDNAIINGNTAYNDLTNPTLPAANQTEIFINQSQDNTVTNNVTIAPVCFLRGTRIATPEGEASVGDLKVGDLVQTHGGSAKPIVWIGVGRLLATRGRRNAATPVIVRRGALADNMPHRDLHVTKGHAFYLDGVLIPIEFLVNHRSIVWDDHTQDVELYHIELDSHDVLLANGAPAESYRDDGNRWLFGNSNSGWELGPKRPCAPVLTGGPIVDGIWRRLLGRAGPRPGFPLTDDPDLHLLVDGRRIDAAFQTEQQSVFRLDKRPMSVRVVSRASAPQELGVARDPRCLGVALRRVVLTHQSHSRHIESTDQRLIHGFHEFEAGDGIRWTSGDASLPPELFDGAAGPMELTLHVGCRTQYLDG